MSVEKLRLPLNKFTSGFEHKLNLFQNKRLCFLSTLTNEILISLQTRSQEFVCVCVGRGGGGGGGATEAIVEQTIE